MSPCQTSAVLQCVFCFLVHLAGPACAAYHCVPSSHNVTCAYPPEECPTISCMRYTFTAYGKIGLEVLLCTETLEKVNWKSSWEIPQFDAICAEILVGSVALVHKLRHLEPHVRIWTTLLCIKCVNVRKWCFWSAKTISLTCGHTKVWLGEMQIIDSRMIYVLVCHFWR